MKRMILSVTVIGFCLTFPFSVGAQQRKKQQPTKRKASQPTVTTQAIPPNEAADLLQKLRGEGAIYIREGWDRKVTFVGAFTPENSFGWRFSNGKRMLGESSGSYYGYLIAVGDSPLTELIGFLYSEAKFFVERESFDEGSHGLYAATDTLLICGGKCANFRLRSKVDEALFVKPTGEQGSPKRPKFSLKQEGKNVFLNVEGNRFLIRLK